MFKKYIGIALLITLIIVAFLTKKNDEISLSSTKAKSEIVYIDRTDYQCITYDGVVRRVSGRHSIMGIVKSYFELIEYDVKGHPKDISAFVFLPKCFYNNVESSNSNRSNGYNNGSSGNNNSRKDNGK